MRAMMFAPKGTVRTSLCRPDASLNFLTPQVQELAPCHIIDATELRAHIRGNVSPDSLLGPAFALAAPFSRAGHVHPGWRVGIGVLGLKAANTLLMSEIKLCGRRRSPQLFFQLG